MQWPNSLLSWSYYTVKSNVMVTSWYGCTKDVNKLALEKPFDFKVANGKIDMCTMHVQCFCIKYEVWSEHKSKKTDWNLQLQSLGRKQAKGEEKKKKERQRRNPLSFSLRSHLIATSAFGAAVHLRHIENPWYVLLFIVVFHPRLLVVNISCTDSLVNSL